MNKLKNPWLWLTIFCILAGINSALPVGEDDIFMQMRIGEEILKTRSVPSVETHSYTIAGTSWVNYQWLSMVFFRGLYALGGLSALVLSRSILTFILFFLYGAWIIKLCHSKTTKRLALILLLPIAFTAISFRIQLRPEYLGFIIFVALLALWTLPYSFNKRTLLSSALICLWSNLHGGTAIFGLALVGAFAWREEEFKNRIAPIVLCTIGFLFTPAHFRVIALLWTHFRYDTSLVFNAEYLGFSLDHLSVGKAGWIVWLWLISNLSVAVFLIYQAYRRELPNPFSDRKKLISLFGLALTALCFQRLRTIPYQLFLITPLLVILLEKVTPWFERQENFIKTLALIPAGIFSFGLYENAPRLSLGINERSVCKRLFERVAQDHPQKEMFTTFSSANYQMWALPQYPVFVDPRDVIYDSIKKRYSQAFNNPEEMKKLLDEYKVNIVLFEIPKFALDREGKPVNALRSFLPKDTWALVDFSNHWVLLYRKIPQHQALLNSEYSLLEPGLSPMASIQAAIQAKKTEQVRKEITNCQKSDPANNFCKIAEASFLRLTMGKSGATQAIPALKDLASESKTKDTIDHYRALEELYASYVTAEDKLGEFQTDQRLKRFSKEDFMPRKLY